MFNGFQQTGIRAITNNPSNMFAGFSERAIGGGSTTNIIQNGLAAWWLSQQGVVLNGSAVASWTDVIGGYTFTQATATNQPTFISADSTYNGYPSITFPSSTQTMSAGNVLNIGTQAGMTIIMALANLHAPGGVAVQPIIKSNSAGGSYFINMYNDSSNNNYLSYFVDTSTNQTPYIQTTSSISTKYVAAEIIDRTNGILRTYQNYVTSTVAISTSLTNYTPSSSLLLNQASSASLAGYTVMEIIIYNRALSLTEIGLNISILKAKYGI